MSDLVIRNATVVTATSGADVLRGEQLGELTILREHDVIVRAGRIAHVRPANARVETPESFKRELDGSGKMVLPSFVDCHTHACWAGDRIQEWTRKLAGATYQQLLADGGGIMSTVRAVRNASVDQLTDQLVPRLDLMLRHGTTTVEIKSGYGLNTEDELKMLRAIRQADSRWPGRICPTACIGHAIDVDRADAASFVSETIERTLPEITNEFPGVPIDAYCEENAWSLGDCQRLFDAAQEAGHPVRIHADQFTSLGMIPLAIERNYLSVDHLEATTHTELAALARSHTLGVMLPCSGFHLDQRFANGREFVDAGGGLAVATNYNPGSAPCFSIPMAMALAVRNLGLTPNEALNATTVNAAAVLGLTEIGRLEAGFHADLIIIEGSEPAELAFEFGGNRVQTVICAGAVVA